MNTYKLIALGLLGGLIGFVMQLPLSWVAGPALKQAGLPTTPSLTGTVWNGQVSNLPVINSLNIKIRPFNLVTRKSPAQFEGRGPGVSLMGQGGPSHIKDVEFSAMMRTLPITDGRLCGLDGNVSLSIENATFSGQVCEEVIGTITSNVLTANKARLQWQGPHLSGPLSCENGALKATISGQDTGTTVNAVVTFNPDGNYQTHVSVKSEDPNAALVMPLYGFQIKGGTYSLTERGRWR